MSSYGPPFTFPPETLESHPRLDQHAILPVKCSEEGNRGVFLLRENWVAIEPSAISLAQYVSGRFSCCGTPAAAKPATTTRPPPSCLGVDLAKARRQFPEHGVDQSPNRPKAIVLRDPLLR